MSGVCKKAFNTINYFNPCSEGFRKDFKATKDWNCLGRWVTYALSIIFGVCGYVPGVLFFRWTVAIVNTCTGKKKVEDNTVPKFPPKIENGGENEEPKKGDVNLEKPIKIEQDPKIKEMIIDEEERPRGVGLSGDRVVQLKKEFLNQAQSKLAWLYGGVKNFGKNLFAKESTKRQQVEWKTRRYEGVVSQWKKAIEACDPKQHFKNTTIINPMYNVLKVLEECEKTFKEEGRFDEANIVQHRENVKAIVVGCIDYIRAEYATSTTNDHKQSLDHLSYLLFQGDLSQEMNYTLKVFNDTEQQPQFEGSTIAEKELFGEVDFLSGLKELWKKIKEAHDDFKTPGASKMANAVNGNVGFDFDPIREGNLPHRMYQLKIGEKSIDVLAIPTPTREVKNWGTSYEIVPEYSGLLRHIKKENKKHLYILNQDILAEGKLGTFGLVGQEKSRCDLILGLQKKDEFKDSFFAVALSKNSKFYNEGGSKDSKEEFGQELFGQIEGSYEKTGCFIPKEIKNKFDNFDKFLKGLIADVLKGYENNELTKEERKAVIEQVYDLLELALIEKLDVDSVQIGCKDTADRGAGSMAQLYGHVSLVQNNSILEPEKNNIAKMLFVRSLFAKKREPIQERVERVVNTFEHTLKDKGANFIKTANTVLGDKKIQVVQVEMK